MHGWLPIVIQAVAAAVLVAAIGWRTRRWRLIWLPVAIAVGCRCRAVGALVHRFAGPGGRSRTAGRCGSGSGLTGIAVAVAVLGWRSARWWRRGVAVLAVPLCLLSAGVALNLWVGYFPTVQTAWNQLTAGPLPDQTDQDTVDGDAAARVLPRTGRWCR